MACCCGEIRAQQHFHAMRARQRGNGAAQPVQHVEILRPREPGPARLRVQHAIEPERAHAMAQVAVTDRVPSSAAEAEAVGVEIAPALPAVCGAVVQVHALVFVRRMAQGHQRRAVRFHRHRFARLEPHRRLHRVQPPLEPFGQHAFQLGLRARQGRDAGVQSQVARGEQADRKRQRLRIGEHHRRQLETGHQHVGAVAAALGGDRDPELLEQRDVAPQRAHVHVDALRQLWAADAAAALQQLEHGEHARGGVGHAGSLARFRT